MSVNENSITPPYYPIIYIRGFAGTMTEVESTVATPFMGFNLGSTRIRQTWEGKMEKYIFESPLVRLMKDHGYQDVYQDGQIKEAPIQPRSIFILRYYDDVSESYGEGRQLRIEDFAIRLSELIKEVRDKICEKDQAKLNAFKVYLVAHSMGGLICRCFLQNPIADELGMRKYVDKVFTYATPHNGIDVRVIGNVMSWLTENKIDNFNRERMADYLALKVSAATPDVPKKVHYLDGKFPEERFFCLIGTNAKDYPAGAGLANDAVGPLSDGLVRIENAIVSGAPRAFVHRSHSGPYGIVNSEEGYNNLIRFLFGNVRATGTLKINRITLPIEIQKLKDKKKKIRASYHIETVVRLRGKRWDLHRRTVDDNSAIFRSYADLFERAEGPRNPVLFSSYLSGSSWAKVKTNRADLGFSVELRIIVPEYTIDGFLFLDNHFEGGYIFRDTVYLLVTPPDSEALPPQVKYRFESGSTSNKWEVAVLTKRGEASFIDIPVKNTKDPGVDAVLEIKIDAWNKCA